MQVYVEMINLEKDIERRRHMQAELDRAGIPARIFPGYDFNVEGTAELEKHCRPEGPWGVFHTQDMACTLSHARVWERFLQSDLPYALVLEDDVFISDELRHWLSDMSWWPKDADLVKIERWRSESLLVLLGQPVLSHLGRTVAPLLSRHVGAAGYILTRRAAEMLLAERPFDITVDNLLFNINASDVAGKMRLYQVQPAMIEQGNEPAQNGARPFTRHRPKGKTLLRQKLKRGYFELAYPVSTIWKALTGKARRARISFEPKVLATAPAPAGD